MSPRRVAAFACEWGCGRKTTTKRKDMVDHEAICRLNPAARCCPTCEHEAIEEGDPETGVARSRYCMMEVLPETYFEPPDPWDLPPGEPCFHWTADRGMVMARGCSKHSDGGGG